MGGAREAEAQGPEAPPEATSWKGATAVALSELSEVLLASRTRKVCSPSPDVSLSGKAYGLVHGNHLRSTVAWRGMWRSLPEAARD